MFNVERIYTRAHNKLIARLNKHILLCLYFVPSICFYFLLLKRCALTLIHVVALLSLIRFCEDDVDKADPRGEGIGAKRRTTSTSISDNDKGNIFILLPFTD